MGSFDQFTLPFRAISEAAAALSARSGEGLAPEWLDIAERVQKQAQATLNKDARADLAIGDAHTALERLDWLDALFPASPETSVLRARAMLALERADDAAAAMKAIGDISAPATAVEAATLLTQLGQLETATRLVSQAISVKGSAAPLKWFAQLATLQYNQRNFQGAFETLSPHGDNPDMLPKWRVLLARIANKMGAIDDAIKQLEIVDSEEAPPAWRAMLADLKSRRNSAGDQTTEGSETSSHYSDLIYSQSEEYRKPPAESVYYRSWQEIAARLGKNELKRVVDIGCGPGQFCEFLIQTMPGIHYTGLDFSAVAVAQAAARCPSAHFLKSDVLREDHLTQLGYDAVVASEVLEHIERDIDLIKRVTAGTYFVGSVPNFDSLGHVRFFTSMDAARDRYEPLLEDFSISSVDLKGSSKLFIFSGRLR